jgi:uncharacterized protein YjiK
MLTPAAWAESGLLARHSLTDESFRQWKLPDKLNEISGLALTDDGRLLAVTDEEAIVYELDYGEGKLVKAFALGEPTLHGDFEGIASDQDRVWLMTSKGVIYESAEGADGERVTFEEFHTGLGDSCEFEGLAFRPGDRVLLLLCKKIRKKSDLEALTIFVWSTADRRVDPAKSISLPDRDIAAALRMTRLNPSGLAIAPRGTSDNDGNLLVVAAKQSALIELEATGKFVSATVLPLASRHRQAEGLEILPSGDILVADEGGEHKARLAIYRRGNQE